MRANVFLENMVVEDVPLLRVAEWAPFTAVDLIEDHEASVMLRYNERNAYILKAVLAYKFTANEKDYSESLERARRALRVTVYGRIWPLLHQVEQAVWDHDREQAIALVGTMRDVMEGKA